MLTVTCSLGRGRPQFTCFLFGEMQLRHYRRSTMRLELRYSYVTIAPPATPATWSPASASVRWFYPTPARYDAMIAMTDTPLQSHTTMIETEADQLQTALSFRETRLTKFRYRAKEHPPQRIETGSRRLWF